MLQVSGMSIGATVDVTAGTLKTAPLFASAPVSPAVNDSEPPPEPDSLNHQTSAATPLPGTMIAAGASVEVAAAPPEAFAVGTAGAEMTAFAVAPPLFAMAMPRANCAPCVSCDGSMNVTMLSEAGVCTTAASELFVPLV